MWGMGKDDSGSKGSEDRDAILKRRGRFVRIAMTGLATATMASCGPCLSMDPVSEGQEQGTEGSDRGEGANDPEGAGEPEDGEPGQDPELAEPEPIACLSVEAPSD